jgi:hypothetical protein
MTSNELTIRRASASDFPRIVELARRALGWEDDDAAFLTWKHLENPFGVSPMWVELDGERVVGFRTFLRWEFVFAGGTVVKAVRGGRHRDRPRVPGRGSSRASPCAGSGFRRRREARVQHPNGRASPVTSRWVGRRSAA